MPSPLNSKGPEAPVANLDKRVLLKGRPARGLSFQQLSIGWGGALRLQTIPPSYQPADDATSDKAAALASSIILMSFSCDTF